MKPMIRDQWIDRFQREAVPVIEKYYGPARIIFFGSRANGRVTEESDIDVIIISEKFMNVPFIRRMEHILKAIRFPRHVDALCYTPDEFERIKTTSVIIENALLGSLQTDNEST
jgi:hypothetical protein